MIIHNAPYPSTGRVLSDTIVRRSQAAAAAAAAATTSERWCSPVQTWCWPPASPTPHTHSISCATEAARELHFAFMI